MHATIIRVHTTALQYTEVGGIGVRVWHRVPILRSPALLAFCVEAYESFRASFHRFHGSFHGSFRRSFMEDMEASTQKNKTQASTGLLHLLLLAPILVRKTDH